MTPDAARATARQVLPNASETAVSTSRSTSRPLREWARSRRASSFVVIAALLTASAAGHASPKAPHAKDPPWVRVDEEDGIKSYTRKVPGSRVVAVRGEGIIDAPIERVISVLLDYRRSTEWIDSVEEVRLVRMLGPRDFIEYDRVATPPLIMKDRDFVSHGQIEVDPKERMVTVSHRPTTDPAVPVNSDYVRGELHGSWRLKSIDAGKRTFVVTEMQADPKGGVAKWLVNLFQESWAYNTLIALRRQVAKRDIKIMKAAREMFGDKPLQFGNDGT
jgi:START domain